MVTPAARPIEGSVGSAKATHGELLHALWCELLGVPLIEPKQNLFDLGARSSLVLRFVTQLRKAGIRSIGVADVYDRPTLAGLAALVAPAGADSAARQRSAPGADKRIAIVGMAVRAAGAPDVDAFWERLLDGREGIRHFAPEELDASIPEELRTRPNFVAARGVLEDADRFDAAFFGVPPREATLIDPQQRLLLELAWNALEHAGIPPGGDRTRIGVYAGTANNSYIAALRSENPELIRQVGEFGASLGSEKDYVATRIAHRLDLHGPALSIHTACSTGLVTVTQAWHALVSGQCDVALAAGATVLVPQEAGYLHVEGGMESADGQCHPFDAQASGTVWGNAGAAVVLKRLDDALADGDTIHAVIRGVGLNNDGADKASFTAPSVTGQAGAIRSAIETSGVEPHAIGYVEAHGTGTAIGDPIEVTALTRAWNEHTTDRQFCVLGSVKGQFGHTIAAAGLLGLIKATLALRHELIPATRNFSTPNPHIDFAATPFRVSGRHEPWPRGAQPRFAAVSSFGVGGTNAHVVLEEAPLPEPPTAAGPAQRWVLPVSARDANALRARAVALADHLDARRDLPLASVAATLVRGRRPMAQRLAVVARSAEEAVAALRQPAQALAALDAPRIVYLFPGQGSQYPGMAGRLYDEAPAFRDALDACLAILGRLMPQTDWRRLIVDAAPDDAEASRALAQTQHAQPALFSMSWSLAAWLDSVGIAPAAMIGHSIGEYCAAARAGVMSLDDALTAVVARGNAMAAQPGGAMLAVRLGVDEIAPELNDGVELAAANAPALSVVAGPQAAIDALARRLEARAVEVTRLIVSHAFHSEAMAGALPAVRNALGTVHLSAPKLPIYSCVSGGLLTAVEAQDPAYWAQQVRAPVRFSAAIGAELAQGKVLFVEVGPGQALTALVRQHRGAELAAPRVVPLLASAKHGQDNARHALAAIGQLWCHGAELTWPLAPSAPRCPLPGYPFAGERHWFARRVAAVPAAATVADNLVPQATPTMNRQPRIEEELRRIVSDVSGVPAGELQAGADLVDQGLDSLSLTQVTLEIERVFGIKLRLRRLLEDLCTLDSLSGFLDQELPADRFAPLAPAAAAPAAAIAGQPLPMQPAMPAFNAPQAGSSLQVIVQQQVQLMAQQLALLSGSAVVAPTPLAPPAVPAAPTDGASAAAPLVRARPDTEPDQPARNALVEKPFGAAARIVLERKTEYTAAQAQWVRDFVARYNARTGRSKAFSQQHRKLMADPRVVTGFNPMWKDLVYPIVVDRSKGARLWDIDGNEYIDLLSCFGANLLGYQPDELVKAMIEQLHAGIEVGPQHPMAAEVAQLIAEFTGMERVAFCNTGSEAVMGAMRIARTVTGRKTIAIFSNSYHGIFDEVVVRGTKQLRSLSAAPGILASSVENILVLDWNSEASLRVLRERGHELAAIMTEPIQNKYPTVQPREFVQELRRIADASGCALIFDEVVTGFRVAPGGAQEFYGVRADIATYGKIIGGGLPFAAIGGASKWLDALDGGHWQYGDDSYPEAGVTYFAGTFVRHPLALAAARASLLHLKRGGRELYRSLNERTERLIERLNTAFALRGAPLKAVHCASLWRLAWDDDQKYVSLFYYLVRFHGLHLYEQFGHFVTEAMGEPELDRIFAVFTAALDELMALGFVTPRPGTPPSGGRKPAAGDTQIAGSVATLPAAAPLTPGQTERWLAASFDENARRALNESLLLELEGAVDEAALRAALADVMQRHEAFRIAFDPSEPLQVSTSVAAPAVHTLDLTRHSDAEARFERFCAEASRTDFALDRAPIGKLTLVQMPGQRTLVHLVVSHLIFDGWASPVFLQELAEAYRARSAGQAPQWHTAAESPRAFGIAEQARWNGAAGRESADYWARELQAPPPPLSLGDLTPAPTRSFNGDTLRTRIDAGLAQALGQRGRHQKATMFQVLLAAVTEAVHRLVGRDDIVVSIPYASQALDRHGPLIADGVLDLPVRLRHRSDFDALLAQTKNRLMDALEHPLATQGSVARSVGITSVGSRPPLTGVFFNLNPRLDVRGFEPLQARVRECRKLGLLSEVVFNFYEQDDGLTLDLHHSTEFFSPQRAQAVVDALMAVLREVAGVAPAAAVATPAVLPAAAPAPDLALSKGELEKLARWNATDTPYETGLRLGDLIRRTVAAHPQATAVRFEGRSVSYAELDGMAWALAAELRATGVKSGDLVGVCLDRSVELVVALVGVTYSGGAYVPLDPAYPLERVTNMCEDANMPVVVTRSGELERVASAIPASVRRVLLDTPRSAPPAELVGTPDDPAYVIFTSGSTGRPKGAMNSHKGIVNRLQWMQQEYQLTLADRAMQKTPYSFDVSVWEFYWPLMIGATIVVARPGGHRDAAYIAQLIADEQITLLHFVPSMLRLFLEDPDAATHCRSVRQVVCSGEALPIDAVDRFFEVLPHARLGNLYGPTEAAVDVTCWNCIAGDKRRIVPIGRPIANTKMYVLGEQLELLPPGAEGELYIGGIQVGMGYVSRPDLTRERFLPDPFVPGGRMYKTGDIGRWLDDGAIEYLGRADHQVKIRGFRIELGEIEAQLMALPAVARCVVVARDFGDGDMGLVAYVVPRGMMPETSELKAHLGKALPEFMVPHVYVAMGDIPLLPNGKIDRKALPMPGTPTARAATRNAAPEAGPLAALVCAEMAALLKRDAVGADDNFFELGGHSLLAARLSTRLAETGHPRPGLRVIFEAPTARKLATWLQSKSEQAQRASRDEAARKVPVLARQDDGPLSLMQQRMWFLESLNPGTNVNNSPSGHVLRGRLDHAAFDRAFRDVIRRQPTLRTSFVETDVGVRQRVRTDIGVTLLPATDLRSIPSERRTVELDRQIAELVSPPFTLADSTMFRARLFQLEDELHVFFFMPHHLIWDAWSFDILYTEMSELYEAYRTNRPAALPDLPVSYLDFSVWQRGWLDGDELARQTDRWIKRLSPLPAALELPHSLRRPAEMSGRGGSFMIVMEGERLQRLQTLAQERGTTVFVTVLALYALVLARASGRSDFCIGTPVRGRESSQLENLMGFFVNMLPLRLSVPDEASLGQWIQSVHEEVRDSFEAPDVPFEHLVRLINPPRDLSRPALHQVSFSYQDVRGRDVQWGNLRHKRYPTAVGGAPQDLSLWCVLTNDTLEFAYIYNTDIMVEADARLISDRLMELIDRTPADLDMALSAYSGRTPGESARLAAWNASAATYDRSATVADLLRAQAARSPADWAVSDPLGGRLTYAELDARSNRLARVLRARGIGRGSLVGLCLERSLEMVIAQHAVLKSGAAYVPLDPAYPADRLQYMAADADLRMLLCDTQTQGRVQWPAEQTLCVTPELAIAASYAADALPRDAQHDAQPADPAYVIYTSGSTGKPKGVVVPHGAVVNFLTSMAREPGLSASDRLVAVTTLSFDIAVLELLLPLTLGAEVVLAGREVVMDGRELRALVEMSGATVMQATPSTWRMLVEAGWQGSSSFKALIGGEPLPVDLAGQMLARTGELWNMYGPTETTVWSTCGRVSGDRGLISIGHPIGNTQIHVLDTNMRPCPIGTPGEIWIGGDGVAVGYLNRPELTAERFVADPFRPHPGARLYRTGDRGRWCHDGQLEHQGRLDHQIKLRGHRIELGEVEAVVAAHPAVARCVAMVREDQPGDQRLVAYIVPREGEPDIDSLRQHAAATLAPYMVPHRWAVLAQIPLLPNGKIDRNTLPRPETQRSATAASSPAVAAQPLTETEAEIARIWSKVLGVEAIGPEDNFFNLGGHSLLAMHAVTEIGHTLGVKLNVRRLIFESLRQVAAASDHGADAAVAASAQAPVEAVTELPPRRKPALLSRIRERLIG